MVVFERRPHLGHFAEGLKLVVSFLFVLDCDKIEELMVVAVDKPMLVVGMAW